MNDNEQRIKEKLDFFMQEKVEVHINLIDKTFINGYIEKEIKEGTYWFIDRKLKGVYLFLKDIYEVEETREEGESG